MDDIAFSDWPGQPVDLAGSNPWLPAYGYQHPATLLDKDDFIGNPDAALFLQGGGSPHYVFLETIVEETSDDLRSESDRSGSRASPVGWLATDSESGSVIHVDLEGIDDIDSGSESELACPAKRRKQDPNQLTIPGIFSDTDSNHSLSRSSSLLQFETLEKHCQDVYSSSPSILSLFSQDSLEQQRKNNDLSPDSLDRCHSDSESESDYYKSLKIDVKSKKYRDRDSLFYNTKRLSDCDLKSDSSDSQNSDETLQVASRSNSCKSVQNLKSCRSFDSLQVNKHKKDKMSAENLSEDSGYSDHLCNYMKNKSSSIPNMQINSHGGIVIPEKSTNKMGNELKKGNTRNSNEDINVFRLKNIKINDGGGFDAYDADPGMQNFASHFGSSYQDLTVFERYEPMMGFRTPLIDRFMKLSGAAGGKRAGAALAPLTPPLTDVLNIVSATVECTSVKFSVLASTSEPNLFKASASETTASVDENDDGCCVVSSVPKDLNFVTTNLTNTDSKWTFSNSPNTRESIAAKNWDLADLSSASDPLNFTDNFGDDAMNKMATNIHRQQDGNNTITITVPSNQRESSIISSGGSDISMPRYRREGSYVKAISDYLDITSITDDEQDNAFHDIPEEQSKKILDLDSQIQKAISESSIQSFTDDTTKMKLLFHSTPISKQKVTSTPNLSMINTDKLFCDNLQDNVEMRRSVQNMPRKSSLIDRSNSSSGMSDPDEKTITSKTFSGSGSTTKGVHFCPIVSEVSWRDSSPSASTGSSSSSSSSSSSDDISSYSISSTPHETTPDIEPIPPLKPPRKSSSQPSLPQNSENDKETEYIFIPLNPAKWASSTPTISQCSSNKVSDYDSFPLIKQPKPGRYLKNGQNENNAVKKKKNNNNRIKQQQQQERNSNGSSSAGKVDDGSSGKFPPTAHVTSRQINNNSNSVVTTSLSVAAVPVMETAVLQPPVQTSAAPKTSTRGKIGGFLSRFASFRFSTRKSTAEDKSKKKASSLKTKLENDKTTNVAAYHPQPVATEKDYIYIPLKGPLPPELEAREKRADNKEQNGDVVVRGGGNSSKKNGDLNSRGSNVLGKPPLPKAPPRVVSACVKQRRDGAGNGGNTASAIDSGLVARNACSMEPMPMGLIETDLDTEVTVITAGPIANSAHVKTRSLMNLGGAEPPPLNIKSLLVGGTGTDNANRPHKSMEFLLDKQNLKAVEPPENELQKSTGERVMSEHQLRVQRSLQKLTVPDWYKQNAVPQQGFILKKQNRTNDARWTGTSAVGGATAAGNHSKTPSLSSLGSGHSPLLLSPQPHNQQPFTRWSTSKLNSAASSPCASTRSSFNHRTSNGGISPCSVRSSFSYRQPYLGWRSQERLSRPRTPAERLATTLLPTQNTINNTTDETENPEIQTSIKEVTSAIVHYVSGLKPDSNDRNSLSPTSSPRFDRENISPRFKDPDNVSERSVSPQSRGSQKLCWLESSFVGTRPLDSPQTPVSLSGADNNQSPNLVLPSTLRLDLQKNINNEMMVHMMELNTSRPSPSSTTLEDVLDSLLGLPPSTRAPSPSLQETASANTSPSKLANLRGDQYRRRSEGSEPSTQPTAVSSEAPRRVSFHASPSPSSAGDNHATIKCRYSKCGKVSGKHSDAGKKYKNCHNCTYIYCSRECRRAHWEKHRMTCLFSRVGALCRQVLAAAKEHKDTLKNLSLLARQGFLAQGNGAVKCFFSSPECAEKFISGNMKALGEPVYVPWADLLPSEMGPNLYSDLIKMCKTYNPDTKFVLYVSVCVVSEVPATGAVKWERQLVSRCAKIRLCKSVLQTITPQVKPADKDVIVHSLTNQVVVQKSREISFLLIQKQLKQRGVSLKKQFPEVYQKLCSYVEGKCDKFAPVTMYPKDITTGKHFMCIIMPDITEPDKLKLKLPSECSMVSVAD